MAQTQCMTTRRPHPWRWMILFARFFWAFISLGVFKSLGVFLPYFMESFSASTMAAGAVNSAYIGIGLVTMGPFVGALLKVFDARWLAIAGGFITAVCTIFASFSSSMATLLVWFTVSSIGSATTQIAAVKPVIDYFHDDFAFANGFSLAGGTTGMMVLPPLTERLIEWYGWRGAMVLLGVLSMNYVVCGALLRPLRKAEAPYSLVPTHGDDTTSSTGTKYLSEDTNGEVKKSINSSVSLSKKLTQVFDMKLVTEPLFMVFQLVFVLEGAIFASWHLFLIPQGVELGFGERSAAFLATFGGLGSLVGRLGHGPLVDRGFVGPRIVFGVACLIFAAATLLDPFLLASYPALAAIAFVSGIAIGTIFPLTYVLMREITGDANWSAYGWLFVTHGFGDLLGGVIAGWIHDVTGDYKFVFIAMGATAVAIVAILLLIRCVTYCDKRND